MSKSQKQITAKPYKESKKMGKLVSRKMQSVAGTYQSQVKADPYLEMRRAIQIAGLNRRALEAKGVL